jgi:1-acyl-sn-glycerol-3-phosphate acyltransferase
MDNWYRLFAALMTTYVRICINEVVTIGHENIFPGPKIIVGNHPNASDGLVLPSVIKEHLHFAAQAEIFTLPGLGMVFRKSGQLPVTVGEGKKFLKHAREQLDKGEPVVIFPEGRLNMNNGLHRAGLGAAVLALQTGLPILPLGFYVPEEYIRVIRSRFYGRSTIGGWQFGGKIYVNFGEAFHLEPIDLEAEESRATIRTYTDEIMLHIDQLSEAAALYASQGSSQPVGTT